MNTEIIAKTARATLEGTMSFPEVVSQLLAAGVEYYHVDYVTRRKAFYSAEGDTVHPHSPRLQSTYTFGGSTILNPNIWMS